MFAHDYRNGTVVAMDPSKWFITAMRWLGLATNLKRTPCSRFNAPCSICNSGGQNELAIQPGCAQIEQLRRECRRI